MTDKLEPAPLAFPGVDLTPEALEKRATAEALQSRLDMVEDVLKDPDLTEPTRTDLMEARAGLRTMIASIERTITAE